MLFKFLKGNLTYPTDIITKEEIAKYCAKENLKYEFIDDNKSGNMMIKIENKKYEIIRPFTGRGGYAIICRPV